MVGRSRSARDRLTRVLNMHHHTQKVSRCPQHELRPYGMLSGGRYFGFAQTPSPPRSGGSFGRLPPPQRFMALRARPSRPIDRAGGATTVPIRIRPSLSVTWGKRKSIYTYGVSMPSIGPNYECMSARCQPCASDMALPYPSYCTSALVYVPRICS